MTQGRCPATGFSATPWGVRAHSTGAGSVVSAVNALIILIRQAEMELLDCGTGLEEEGQADHACGQRPFIET